MDVRNTKPAASHLQCNLAVLKEFEPNHFQLSWKAFLNLFIFWGNNCNVFIVTCHIGAHHVRSIFTHFKNPYNLTILT